MFARKGELWGWLAEYAAWVLILAAVAPAARIVFEHAELDAFKLAAGVLAAPMRIHESMVRYLSLAGVVDETWLAFINTTYEQPSKVAFYLLPVLINLTWLVLPLAVARLLVPQGVVGLGSAAASNIAGPSPGRLRDASRRRGKALALAITAIAIPFVFLAWQGARGLMLIMSFAVALSEEPPPTDADFLLFFVLGAGIYLLSMLGTPLLCMVSRRVAVAAWRRLRAGNP